MGSARASRAVFRALAEHRSTFERPNRLVMAGGLPSDRRGRRSAHARARVLPETNCIVPVGVRVGQSSPHVIHITPQLPALD